METKKILLEYTIPDISRIILDYAFRCSLQKYYFELGYYEKCVIVLEEISHLDINRVNLGLLLNSLLYESCRE